MQTAIAQTAQIFKSYEDPILGVSIQYPSDWIITTEKNHIRFNPPESYKPLPLQAFIVSVESLAPTITSLDQYVREKYSSSRTPDMNFSVSDSTLQGIPAKKIVSTASEVLLSKSMDIVMIKDRTVYILDYFSGTSATNKAEVEQHFDSLLPTAQKMIDSFKVLH